jgi:hypothetical protein
MRRDYLMNVFPMVISVYLLVTRDVNRWKVWHLQYILW